AGLATAGRPLGTRTVVGAGIGAADERYSASADLAGDAPGVAGDCSTVWTGAGRAGAARAAFGSCVAAGLQAGSGVAAQYLAAVPASRLRGAMVRHGVGSAGDRGGVAVAAQAAVVVMPGVPQSKSTPPQPSPA